MDVLKLGQQAAQRCSGRRPYAMPAVSPVTTRVVASPSGCGAPRAAVVSVQQVSGPYRAGKTAGAPFFLIRTTTNRARSVLLAFLPTRWVSSGPS
jgi:hypothetical protein